MKKPSVTMDELWAAQAQFGPFGIEVIRELQQEWDRYFTSPAQNHTPGSEATAPTPRSELSS